MNIYDELFRILASDGIKSIKDDISDRGQSYNKSRIEETLVEFFIKNGEKIIEQFRDLNGNRFVFYDADRRMAKIAKKSLLYSQTSLFVSNQSIQNTISYWLAESDGCQVPENNYPAFSKEFIQNMFDLKPLLLNGAAIIIPGHISQDVEYGEEQYSDFHKWKEVIQKAHDEVNYYPETDLKIPRDGLNAVRLESTKESVLEIVATEEKVYQQLTEEELDSGLSVQLFLPRLENLSLEQLANLREEEGDAFIRFQHTLKKFFKADPGKSSTLNFMDMLEEVDYEIRVLNQRFDKIKQKRAYEISGLALTGLGLASLYTLPIETAKIVSQVLGVASISTVLKYIAGGEWSTRQIQDSDFYYAWKAGRLKK